MLESHLREELTRLLGNTKIDTARVTLCLNEKGIDNVKSFLYFLAESSMFKPSDLYSPEKADEYIKAAEKESQCLAQHIVNAGDIYERLSSLYSTPKDTIGRLETMTMRHILYILFKATGMDSLASPYKKDFISYIDRWPEALKELPEEVRVKVLKHDSTGLRLHVTTVKSCSVIFVPLESNLY